MRGYSVIHVDLRPESLAIIARSSSRQLSINTLTFGENDELLVMKNDDDGFINSSEVVASRRNGCFEGCVEFAGISNDLNLVSECVDAVIL